MTGGTNDTKTVKTIVGKRIKQARKLNNHKMTQQALADKLSCSEKAPILNGKLNAVSLNRLKKWEDGTNPVELEWIPAVCDVLECDVGYLFGEYEELTRQASDVCKETGLSEDAIKALRSMGNVKLKDGVLHRTEFQDMISCMFEDPRFSSIIPHIIEAERLLQPQEIDNNLLAENFIESIDNVESFGYIVLKREDARQFHLRQAAQAFLSIVNDIGTGESNGK